MRTRLHASRGNDDSTTVQGLAEQKLEPTTMRLYSVSTLDTFRQKISSSLYPLCASRGRGYSYRLLPLVFIRLYRKLAKVGKELLKEHVWPWTYGHSSFCPILGVTDSPQRQQRRGVGFRT